MAKDKRIGELPGISAAAVVGLNRAGVESVHDLLAAEFDRLAYIVDDYNEAARLVREARKLANGEQTSSRRGAKHSPEALVPGPLTSIADQGLMPREHSKSGPSPAAPQGTEAIIGAALWLAARGLVLTGPAAAAGRAALGRRLNIAGLLLEHGAGEAEVAAAVILEPAEAGLIPSDEISSRFGEAVERLLEECAGLRAVPMLPSGKLPRYYLEMASAASREARRVCAAHVLVGLHGLGGTGGTGAKSAHLLVEALAMGGPDDLIQRARATLAEATRAAA